MTEVNTLRVVLDGQELPGSSIGLPLVIQHGRSGTDSQPDSPKLTLVWCEETAPFEAGLVVDVFLDLPTAGTHTTWGSPTAPWGSPGHTWLGATVGVSQRFHGRVTDVTAVEQDWVIL